MFAGLVWFYVYSLLYFDACRFLVFGVLFLGAGYLWVVGLIISRFGVVMSVVRGRLWVLQFY